MEALQKFLTCKQNNGQSIDDYRRQLMLWCATIEHFGGTVVGNFELADSQDSNGITRTTDERKEAARQEVLAMHGTLARLGSDKIRLVARPPRKSVCIRA
jgi:hypothetical protein